MPRAVLLPHAPSSVTSARQRLCSDLRASGLETPKVEDAALVLSELLSNALRHAEPLPAPFPPGSVRVTWEVEVLPGDNEGGWLEISVCDGGAETLPRIARPSRSALGGRGLGIVQHLAAKWGTEVDDRVTTVWAVLEVSPEESATMRTGALPAGRAEAEEPDEAASGASGRPEPEATRA